MKYLYNLICYWLGHVWIQMDAHDGIYVYRCDRCGEVASTGNQEFAKRVANSSS